MLNNILKLTKEYKLYLMTNNIDAGNYIIKFIEKFNKQITKLNKYLHDKNIKDYIENNQSYLFMIHDVLVGQFCKTYVSDKETLNKLRQSHDSFFQCFRITCPGKKFARITTWLSTNFCKGITFFENDAGINEIPFYHRDQSCGSKKRSAIEKFKDSKNKYKHIYVRNCYIERKIYDMIYINTMHRQDINHLFELKMIEKIYQDYYQNENLSINISYFDDDINPCCLQISSETSKYERTLEIYTKSLSSDLVQCKKIMPNGKILEKIQNGEHEEAWLVPA